MVVVSAFVAPASAQKTSAILEIDLPKQALAAVQDQEFRIARMAIRLVADPFQRDALLFRLYRRTGNNASAEEIIRFIERHPDWPLQITLRQRAEGAHLGRIADKRLIDWLTKNPPTTRLGCNRLIERLEKRSNRSANDAIARCWKSISMSADGETRFLKRYGKRLSAKEKASRVLVHLSKRQYPRAKDLLAQIEIPEKLSVPLEVRIDLQRKPRKTTVGKLIRVLPKLPPETKADEAFVLDLVRWNRRRRNVAAAIRYLSTAPNPVTQSTRLWWQERSAVTRQLLDGRQHLQAYAVAADHRQAPGDQFSSAESLAGWIALRKRRKTDRAVIHFQAILDKATRHDVKAMAGFWLGEVSRARKQRDKAAAWYRVAARVSFSLYGQMSLMRLKTDALRLPDDTVVPEDLRAAFDREPAARLAKFYADNEDIAQSRLMLWWLFKKTSRATGAMPAASASTKTGYRLAMIADIAGELGQQDIALQAARAALIFGIRRWVLAYPAPKLPSALPVEAALVLAIIRQESEFRVDARSTSNAQGLMQLLPSTARSMARRLKLKWDPAKLTVDGDYNTRLGAAYLSLLLRKYDRSYLLASAAYNAGPSRVDRWINRYGQPDRDVNAVDWIEQIPFGETRNYVRRILSNVLVYRTRLGGGKLASTPTTTWRPPVGKKRCKVTGNCKKNR